MYHKKCKGPFRSIRTIALASGSPRRKRLLEALGLDFYVCSTDVKELDPASGLTPAEFTMQNAKLKLDGAVDICSQDFIICADTCVFHADRILGKPRHFAEAKAMLHYLSRKWHQVFTSFVVWQRSDGSLRQETVVSRVFLDPLNEDVISAYCSSDEPYDKAGGYAVQGTGAFLVRGIDGSYTNVVGLPLTEILAALLDMGAVEPCVKD